MIADERFRTNLARTENHAEMERLLAERLRTRKSAEWLAEFSAAGIPAAPIRDMQEVLADRTLRDRGLLHEMRNKRGTPSSPPVRRCE